jgi:kelch-like protein 20
VDVYDSQTGQWAVDFLPFECGALSGVAAGNFILFAGGGNTTGLSKLVNIYNTASNTWSTAELNESRAFLASASCGTKIIFAGGKNGVNPTDISSVADMFELK